MEAWKKIRVMPGYPLVLGANKMADGYNFALEIPREKQASLLLYYKKSDEPSIEIPFGKEPEAGSVRTLFLKGFKAKDYEYNYSVDGKILKDPYAYRISGREQFGMPMDGEHVHKIRCGFLSEKPYDWEDDSAPGIPYEDMILYKLHVRGYTKQAKLSPGKKGTFCGLMEMIPYLKDLGVNAVELMPAYEFFEVPSVGENSGMVSQKRKEKLNFWGYLPGFYFAPKQAYCASREPEREFRDLVKAFHKAGMECIMEFYFQKEANPSAVLRALQFWKLYYHVDGFHLLGEGVPANLLLKDGILSETKLMLDNVPAWDIPEEHLAYGRYLAEYNPGFLQDMRRFLKSDEGMLNAVSYRIKENFHTHGVIHYMACQDGFTLADTVSYNYKHNEENGENNQDGSSFNYSWNCGVEGPSRRSAVIRSRERQMRNAFLMLLLSQGVPMIYGGDEIANSQGGNNNAYCQDNPVGWIDWKGLKKQEKLLQFVKDAIAFRKEHPALHQGKELKGVDYLAKGLPDISFHQERAWYCSYENTSRLLGVMYCGAYGKKEDHSPDEAVYIAYNFHWENRKIALPNLPKGTVWKKVIDTYDASGSFHESEESYEKNIEIMPRTIVVLLGRQEA